MKQLAVITVLLCFHLATKAQGSLGLVAHWDFNGTTNDVSGNGHDGIPFWTSFTAGMTGASSTALYLDGDSAHVDVPTDSQLELDTFSILTSIKFHSFYDGLCQGNYILCRGDEFADNFYGLYVSDGMWDQECYNLCDSVSFQMGASGVYSPPVTYWANSGLNPRLDTGVWYCVAGTYDGDTARIYVDGVLVAFMPWTQQHGSALTDTLGIGYFPRGATGLFPYYVHGDIDDIRLYSRPLSAAELTSFCDSVAMPAAVGEIVNVSQMRVFPNPAKGTITVLNNMAKPGNGIYKLLTPMGTVVRSVSGNREVAIDIRDLTPGYYFITFTDLAGTCSTRFLKE